MNKPLFTLTGFILFSISLLAWYLGYHTLAPCLTTIALFLAYIDVKKFTGNFQFIVVFLAAMLTGLYVDISQNAYPWVTLSIVFSSIALLVRIVAFRFFAYTRYIYSEIVIVLIAAVFYLTGVLLHPSSLQVWIFPLPVWIVSVIYSYAIIKDKRQLIKGGAGGYKVVVGEEAPNFELLDEENKPVSLQDYKGKNNLLLIFVRGDWCPGCHMMLRTYEKNREKFQNKNIVVMAIGPDPVGVNKAMVQKLNLDYKVLADEGQKTAMRYGVQLNHYEHNFSENYQEGIPLPATFLVDINSKVRYVSRPDRVGEFLNPSLIFPIIEKI